MNSIVVKDLVLSRSTDKKSTDDTVILKGLNAEFKKGQLNAVMGPNGCGKTTFLTTLFGKIDSSIKTSGEILYNGKERNLKEWYDDVSYVEQDCFEIKNQTVMDSIQFSIRMMKVKTGKSISEEKLADIIRALNLTPILTKNINEISGGERKRAMIAIELAMMKKVLILDEPTADLDSHLALQLIIYLKKIAEENNVTVIFTIHQPSDQVFKRFDNILFILEGRVIYFGKTADFLTSQNLVKPEDWTISDFIFEAFYNKAEFKEFKDLKESINKMMIDSSMRSNLIVASADLKTKSSQAIFDWKFSFGHFSLLFKRSFNLIFKSKKIYYSLLGLMILFSIALFGASYTLKSLKYSDMTKDFGPLPGITFEPTASFGGLVFGNEAYEKTPTNEAILKFVTFEFNRNFAGVIVSLMGCILFFDSTILAMRDQFINEVSKGLYSSFTLFVTTIVMELFFFMIATVLLLGLAISTGMTKHITAMDFGHLVGYGAILSLINSHFTTILALPFVSNSFAKNFIYCVKGFGVSTHTYPLFFAPFTKIVPFLETPMKNAGAAVIFSLFPSHFYWFLVKMTQLNGLSDLLDNINFPFADLLKTTYIKQNEGFLFTGYKQIFYDGVFDNKWMVAGLVGSLIFIMASSTMLFSKIFNPKIAIKI